MGRKEYLEKRNALLNEAKELLDAGKVAEAKAKKEEIEKIIPKKETVVQKKEEGIILEKLFK